MPLYMIERKFAEQLDLTNDDVKLIEEINADEGVRWLFSFLSADRRRTYCLYEAPSPDAIVAAARPRRGRLPVPVGGGVGPGTPGFIGPPGGARAAGVALGSSRSRSARPRRPALIPAYGAHSRMGRPSTRAGA